MNSFHTKSSVPPTCFAMVAAAILWLGFCAAQGQLGSQIQINPVAEDAHAPIPIWFSLPEEGFVTLVIEDSNGKRVRNLVSETKFSTGANVVWWDGTDDLLRDPEAYRHGLYFIPPQFVALGTYRVMGLWHKAIDLRYEFSVYNAGNWHCDDLAGD